MSGLFRGLQIGISTLMTNQRAIDVTNQNIANVNTPGYQRQRVDFRELSGPSGMINPPLMGNGVYAQAVERFVTPFIDEQLRRQRNVLQNASQMENVLSDVESMLTEPAETGISAQLDNFWQAWQALSASPSERSSRILLVQTASQLTSSLNETTQYVDDVRNNLNSQIRSHVDRINGIAEEIQGLNRQILKANAVAGGNQSGAPPLEQRRDALLFELSDIVDFNLNVDDSGLAQISIGTYSLVDGSGAHSISLNDKFDPVWTKNDVPLEIHSGKMNGLLQMRDQALPSLTNQLDELAQGLIENVNEIHQNGYGLDGSTNLPFFTGNDAGSIAVNEDLMAAPEKLATAKAPNSVGDNAIALQIGALATDPVLGGIPPTVSLNGFYRSLIADLGMRVQHARNTRASSEMVFNHLTDRRQAVSGVSMDEEVANLLSYEKAFQAGARIINVVDEMLDQVINRMGLVGR